MPDTNPQTPRDPGPGTPAGPSPGRGTSTLDLLQRARGLYMEMPGLRLTAPQAARLLGAPLRDCELVLAAMVQSGFLARSPNLTYRRTWDGPEASVA